jgi:hypothetical protein
MSSVCEYVSSELQVGELNSFFAELVDEVSAFMNLTYHSQPRSPEIFTQTIKNMYSTGTYGTRLVHVHKRKSGNELLLFFVAKCSHGEDLIRDIMNFFFFAEGHKFSKNRFGIAASDGIMWVGH